MRLTIWSAAAVTLALAAAAVPAQAGTVELRFSYTGVTPPEPKGGSSHTFQVYDLVFKSEPGEVSDLSVSLGPQPSAGIRLHDNGAPLTPGPNCARDGADVVCSVTPGASQIGNRTYDLGDGDDSVTLIRTFGTVDAGPGNDTVRFTDSSGTAKLGPGDDTATADKQETTPTVAFTVDGGPGADTIGPVAGGRVRASYADRSAAVDATLDGVANDGEPGEHDQLGPGVRAIVGGSAADTLTGGPGDNALMGGAGDDVVRGLAGADALEGGDGNDTLDGGEGDESFTPEPGADTVRGGAGSDSMTYVRTETDPKAVNASLDDQPGDGQPGENDDIGSDVEALEGGWGSDRLIGSDGPDRLIAVRGADVLDGRGGADILTSNEAAVATLTGGPGIDAFQRVGILDTVKAADGEADTVDCRDSGIGAIEGDAADTGADCLAGLDVPNNRRRVKVDRRGVVRLPVTCGDLGLVCTGSVSLTYAGRAVDRTRLSVREGATRGAKLRLTRRARLALLGRRSLRATVTFSTTRSLPAETRKHSEAVRLVAAR